MYALKGETCMNYNAIRRRTPEVRIGKIAIGGQNPIAIQSMTNTDTHDIHGTIEQIKALASAGCDIVRITVPDLEAAETILAIKEQGITTPIVADIHFDYKVALRCAEYGVDKIRINPGNIGDDDRVKAVVDACKTKNIPIRIGVNGGSLDKKTTVHGKVIAAVITYAAGCASSRPTKPFPLYFSNKYGSKYIIGMNATPFCNADKSIAGTLLPMLWNIIFPTTVNGKTQSTIQLNRKACAPIFSIRADFSELKSEIIVGAYVKQTTERVPMNIKPKNIVT